MAKQKLKNQSQNPVDQDAIQLIDHDGVDDVAADLSILSAQIDERPNAQNLAWLDRIPQDLRREWQIVFSKKLNRPFFYHIASRTGQLRIPSPFQEYLESSANDTYVQEAASSMSSLEPDVSGILSENDFTQSQSLSLNQSQSQSQRRTRSSKRKIAEVDSSIETKKDPVSVKFIEPEPQRTRRTMRGRSADHSFESPTMAQDLFLSSPNSEIRESMQREERLFLTAESQDPSLSHFPLHRMADPSLLDRVQDKATVLKVGENANSSFALSSSLHSNSRYLSSYLPAVETIDMTDSLAEALPRLSQRSEAFTSPDKTQIDVELLTNCTSSDNDDSHIGAEYIRVVADGDVKPVTSSDYPNGNAISSTWTPSHSQSTAVPTTARSEPWRCTFCTFDNPAPCAKCEMCDSVNPLYLNIASRPKRLSTPTPNTSSFTFNQDALRRMQQSSSAQNKKKKLQQATITTSLNK